jgi:hypothetical protein
MSSSPPPLIQGDLEHEAFRKDRGETSGSISSGMLDRLTRSLGYGKLDLEERSRRLLAFLLVIMTTPALLGACWHYMSQGKYFTGFSILQGCCIFLVAPRRERSCQRIRALRRFS